MRQCVRFRLAIPRLPFKRQCVLQAILTMAELPQQKAPMVRRGHDFTIRVKG